MLQCRSSMPGLLSPLPLQPWIFHRFIWPEPPNPPSTHTQCKTVPNQFCCHKPNLYQSRIQAEKWRNCSCFLVTTALVGVNVNCWSNITEETMKTKSWKVSGKVDIVINSVIVKKYIYQNDWKPSKTPLLPAHRFCPPHAHLLFCFQGWRSVSHRGFSVSGVMNMILYHFVCACPHHISSNSSHIFQK